MSRETAGSMHINACKDCAEERPGSTHTNVCYDFPGVTVGETFTNVYIGCHRERAQIIGTKQCTCFLLQTRCLNKKTSVSQRTKEIMEEDLSLFYSCWQECTDKIPVGHQICIHY